MADYKLYDQNNHSVLTDSFEHYEVAAELARRQAGYEVIKESIPPALKENIENHLGKIVYSNERLNNEGHFAIVHDKVHGDFSAVKVQNRLEGVEVQVKSGFPDQQQAYSFIDKQQSIEKLHANEMEIGR